MKKSPAASIAFSVQVGGKEYSARYTVASGLVTVYYGLDSKTTQIGGSTAELVARMLLRELVESAKKSGTT